MKVYCRPGSNPVERLETHVAHHLRTDPGFPTQLASLLVWATGCGPVPAAEIRAALPDGCVADPAESLGMARAALLLCGVSPERRTRLTGDPKEDFFRLMEGSLGPDDATSPALYAVPSLLDSYCYMGASFARGMDRVFKPLTGKPLKDHLSRALSILEPAV